MKQFFCATGTIVFGAVLGFAFSNIVGWKQTEHAFDECKYGGQFIQTNAPYLPESYFCKK
jgi:hypothetical protein